MSEYEWAEGAPGAAAPVIVSRHAAAVEFIKSVVALPEDVRVVASATERDVAGRVVYGNIPLSLAACARIVWAVEFEGPPPRGQEYTAQDMRDCGAVLRAYRVTTASCRWCCTEMTPDSVQTNGGVCDYCRGAVE